jgi:hypothetical protein
MPAHLIREELSEKKFLSCFLFLTACAWAQSTAQISGTVRDQTGAVIPGSQVSATNTDTGLKCATATDASGA